MECPEPQSNGVWLLISHPDALCLSSECKASDVYSFAILLYEMVTGRRPYPGLSTNDIMYGVVHHKLRPRMPGDIPRSDMFQLHFLPFPCLVKSCEKVVFAISGRYYSS